MKFYEFNEFEYFKEYALIGAKSEEEAIEFYEDIVADIDGDAGIPMQITHEEAKEKLMSIYKSEDEKIRANDEFEIYAAGNEPCLVLIDWKLT